MYRALYRKWRPRTFADVVGQEAVVQALRNQVAADRVGHAYLFTGTRGTGKTSCAKILAKAVNCPHCKDGDPCGVCEICRGVEDGSLLDVVEIDAASNNGVDDVRDLREDALYTPAGGRRKVYIIDEVHMLTGQAFNALLKIMEEPPPHLLFILATTEIHKVPVTVLSRCQRYDFLRITPQAIAQRLLYVAGQEDIRLTEEAAALLGRLADGALRDALSLLDTCSSMGAVVDEALVRQVAGVSDKSYLFSISDALSAADPQALMTALNDPRAASLDTRRLCEELITHYRDLMLAAVAPKGTLLGSVGDAERETYMARGRQLPVERSAAAVRRLGEALERMARSGAARIELELALLELTGALPAAAQPAAKTAASKEAGPAPAPDRPATPRAAQPTQAPAQPAQQPTTPTPPAVPDAAPAGGTADTTPPPTPPTQQPAASAAGQGQPAAPAPFAAWEQVVATAAAQDAALGGFLRGSAAYRKGNRVLIQGNAMLYDYLRTNGHSHGVLKAALQSVCGEALGIGPYTAPAAGKAEDPLDKLRRMGVPVEEV